MTERWWAPSAPALGPTPADLALLSPGPEPDKDLGAALLAAHRVGAAACLATARTPLADEVTLVRNLAAARADLAPPMVTTIAKAVDGEVYAGLLARDVLDDAETAALQLYRSCVAKGVTPTVAFERVGMVYGVPADGLSAFSKLATDPRANPQALVDAADKALFTHVADVVAAESVQAKEEVSKAPAQTKTKVDPAVAAMLAQVSPDDPATPYYDARSRGKFARTAAKPADTVVGGVNLDELLRGPSRVGTKPAEEAKTTPTVGEKPKRRMARTARMARTVAPRQATNVKGREAKGRKLKGRRIVERVTAAREAKLRDITAAFEEKVQQRQASSARVARKIPDTLARRPDLEGATMLGEELSYVFVSDEWSAFAREAGLANNPGYKVLRQGALVDYHGGTPHRTHETIRDEDGFEFTAVSADYDMVVGSVVERHREDNELQERIDPIVFDITPDQEATLSSTQSLRDAQLAEIAEEHIREYLMDHGFTGFRMEAESPHWEVLQDYDQRGKLKIVWRPPMEGEGQLAERPTVNITEVIVSPKVARGVKTDEGSRFAEPSYTMDPNQGLAFKVVGNRTFFDSKYGAYRTEVKVIPVEEGVLDEAARNRDAAQKPPKRRFGRDDIGKAVTLERTRTVTRDDPATPYYDARSAGRFARTADLQAWLDAGPRQETPAKPKRRMARMARTARMATPPATMARDAQARPTQARSTSGRRAGRREALARETSRREAQAIMGLPPDRFQGEDLHLDPDSSYLVMDDSDLTDLEADEGFRVEGGRTFLSSYGRAVLLEGDEFRNATETYSHIYDLTNNDQFDLEYETEEGIRIFLPATALKVGDLNSPALYHLEQRLQKAIREDPRAQWFRVFMRADKTDPEKVWVRVDTNRQRLPERSVIRYPGGADPDAQLELVDHGMKNGLPAERVASHIRMLYASYRQQMEESGGRARIAETQFEVPRVRLYNLEEVQAQRRPRRFNAGHNRRDE